MGFLSLTTAFLAMVTVVTGQDYCPVANNFNYHTATPQTIRSFQGIYHSNFNETLTFCNFKAKSFELDTWNIIPVLAQTAYGQHMPYTTVGAVLTGSTYIASNGSVIWRGFGFSATGPYDCAFALGPAGKKANGFYTYVDQKNGSSPAGETGPWLLSYVREPTWSECNFVFRGYSAADYEQGCTIGG